MAFHFTQDHNTSGDGYNVKPLKALKARSPGKKLTALVPKDKDFDFDRCDLYGCTNPPALDEERVCLKHGELHPDVDGYLGCNECEKLWRKVPVSVNSDKDDDGFDAWLRSYEASRVPGMSFLFGNLSSEIHDKLVDILHKIDSLNSRPTPTQRSVTSLPQYTAMSPLYSPILPKP